MDLEYVPMPMFYVLNGETKRPLFMPDSLFNGLAAAIFSKESLAKQAIENHLPENSEIHPISDTAVLDKLLEHWGTKGVVHVGIDPDNETGIPFRHITVESLRKAIRGKFK